MAAAEAASLQAPLIQPADGRPLRVGVLAMQGAFREHTKAIRALGAEAVEVRLPDQLGGIGGLILPGGESTTIGQLIQEFGFDSAIHAFAAAGKPVYGTCAGMILLADDVADSAQYRLGLMHMRARRNAFGRQRDSFEASLAIPAIGNEPVAAVFIRAPYIETVSEGCEVLATYEGKIVMAREGNCLATAFHPELTEDLQVHRFFLDMVRAAAETAPLRA